MKDDNGSKYPEADSTLLTSNINLNNRLCSIVSASSFTCVDDDIANVETELQDVNARWYQIGVALGLSTNTLDQRKDLPVNAKYSTLNKNYCQTIYMSTRVVL